MYNQIVNELKKHAPFTLLGAVSGIIVIFLFHGMPPKISNSVFYILHPIHVVLSATVTGSMYKLHSYGCQKGKCNILILLAIGYAGSIGIATISDSLIPYLGEILLRMPNRAIHIGFIEKWWLVNPLAIIGVLIAYYRPQTMFPHAGHVLLSTWASLFHIIMAKGSAMSLLFYPVVIVFLFLAVWIPCCMSDIIFPLMFVKQ